MFRFAVCVAALACVATTAYASDSSYAAPASYAEPASYAAPSYAPEVVDLPQEAEAQANAQSSNAAAIASAAKINSVNLHALDNYGYQVGVPLLTRPYGILTPLYSAALQPRSFVAKIAPHFVKGPYGKIQHVGESSLGVAVI